MELEADASSSDGGRNGRQSYNVQKGGLLRRHTGMLQDGLILATDNNTGLTPQTGHLI